MGWWGMGGIQRKVGVASGRAKSWAVKCQQHGNKSDVKNSVSFQNKKKKQENKEGMGFTVRPEGQVGGGIQAGGWMGGWVVGWTVFGLCSVGES